MSRIREVIKINSGYTSYVDLNQEFFYYNEEKNLGRMERYMPIKAHRLAFEKIANSLNPKDRRFYFLSGSYGTGKSHLCLMLGNYFAKQSNSLEMEAFFNNYDCAQKDILLKPGESLEEKPASRLKVDRKKGIFLVAICRYALNLEFEGVILRAIEEALEIQGSNITLDTHYKEALRKLKDWESKKTEKRFYNDFITELNQNHPDWTLEKLEQGLKKPDELAFKVFKRIYRVITDTDFTFSRDNLQDILIDILKNENFRSIFKGIVIVYDEFGYALDDNLVNLKQLHEFSQFCANSGLNYLPVIFIGTGHKPFPKHGQVGDAIHYNTLKDRVNEIPLQTEGMEDLIGAIVQQKKSEIVWKKEVEPFTDMFSRFPIECKRFGIFNWLPAPKLKNNIIENIYPMHPLATYALLQMAKDMGSDNRSVFKFFSPEFEAGDEHWKNVQKYSYPWFIENNEIEVNGKLNLYTIDVLFDYFQDAIKAEDKRLLPRQRASIANYEATHRELNNYIRRETKTKLFSEVDEFIQQILKGMLIHEIISTEQVPIINTCENIHFGLNAVTPSEKEAINNRLEVLCKSGILYKNENQVYEFRRSDIKDVRRMVNEFIANPENHPDNILDIFLEYVPLGLEEKFLEAKDYNTTYNEDKRLKVKFVLPSELEQDYKIEGRNISFFEKLEIERIESGHDKDSYEGIAVFVFCENNEAIEHAKRSISQNKKERIAIGLPKKPLVVFNDVITLMAVKAIQSSKEAETFGPHESAQLIEIRTTATEKLEEVKEQYFNNKFMHWFSTKGSKLSVSESKKYDVANNVMRSLFEGKRNAFSHAEFNRTHIKNDGTVRRIMVEAGNLLLDLTKNVEIDWTLPENRGGTKYLRRCFVDNQVLILIHSEGDIRYFEIERNPNKFKNAIPIYQKMINDLEALEGKGAKLCKNFFQPYFEEYGQGEIAVALLFLCARRFYGDCIRLKREEFALTDIHLDDTDKIIDLVNGKEPSTVVIFEEITEEEKNYFNQICEVFRKEEVEAGKVYGINDAYKSIISWWEALPGIAKSEQFYDDEFKTYIEEFRAAETKDPYVFIKFSVLALFDISKEEKITKDKLSRIKQKLELFKKTALDILSNQEQVILTKISEVFGAEGILDVDIQEALKSWYKELDSYQKDKFSKFHSNESKILISRVDRLANIRELIFVDYPEAFGFAAVSDWSLNNTDEYINKIEEAKKQIEKNKSPVGDISIEFENDQKVQENTVYYRGTLGVKIIPAQDDDIVYYTDNYSDPSDNKSERKRLQKGETIYVHQGNYKLNVVACNKEKRYGKVHSIEIIDDAQKYQIKRPAQRKIGDTPITFVFPADEEGARISIESLLHELADSDVISQRRLKALLEEILSKMKTNND